MAGFGGVGTRVAAAVEPAVGWVGLLTVALAGTVLPLRFAARWGGLGHAFAITLGSVPGGGMVLFALGQSWAQSRCCDGGALCG
ncbi:MAG: hypothetical protein OEM84_14690 [Acidimicrobiia bacterium]|nr:hypothetical protein [Acidimicrobiia bacterium]